MNYVKKKIRRTFPVALAVQAFSAPAAEVPVSQQGEVTESRVEAESPSSITLTPDAITTTITRLFSQTGDSFEQQVPVWPEEWDDEHEQRYDELVEKEALRAISRAELGELNSLQAIRRSFVNPPTSEELLLRLRRERLDRELVRILQRNVSLQDFPAHRA